MQGRIQRFWKGVALYVGHHSWPPKKILGFRWSKKAKITLETSFGQNISTWIFKFSPYLYTVKACQWNRINFSKFTNALTRKEKKDLCSSQREKKLRKVGPYFITGCFIKSFDMIIYDLLFLKLIRSPTFAFWYQDDTRNIKRRSREQQMASKITIFISKIISIV